MALMLIAASENLSEVNSQVGSRPEPRQYSSSRYRLLCGFMKREGF